MCVPILVSEGESVVTLTTTSICESTAETIVVVAVVVLSIVVVTVSVLSIVVLTVVVLTVSILSVVVAIVVIVITAAPTVVASPTKEEPQNLIFILNILTFNLI